MRRKDFLLPTGLLVGLVLTVTLLNGQSLAQADGPNPTPIVISLTPPGTPGPVATATPGGAASTPDRFEPNNEAAAATSLGWQLVPELTLVGDDVDFFTGYLKAGQILRLTTTVYGDLDTVLQLFWQGALIVENDDRTPADVGSQLFFTAPTDGWYTARVAKATVYDGRYDLEAALVAPTATATLLPTATPSPTLTPTPSATPLVPPDTAEPNNSPAAARPITPGVRGSYSLDVGDLDYFTFIAKVGNRYTCETESEVVDTRLTVLGPAGEVLAVNDDRSPARVDSFLAWTTAVEQPILVLVEGRGGSFGAYVLLCQATAPAVSPGPAAPSGAASFGTPSFGAPASVAAATAATLSAPAPVLTATGRITLTVQHVGQVQPQTTTATTTIRLLVYYDANNDRQPGPGEGVANVSVLAVDAQGQQLVRIFTNAQGEAIFNLNGDSLSRVMVPFVPGWSARVRVGEMNNDIVLGLPAVRLPVFLPVQTLVNREEE